MSVEAWAETAHRNEYRQDPEHQHTIDIVKDLLEGKTDSDGAANTVASIYSPRLKRGFDAILISTLWDIVCDAGRTLGGNTDIADRLVSLLVSISVLPDLMDEHGNASAVRWRDLPEFAIKFREYVIDIEPLTEMRGGDWDALAVSLLNATIFGATYLTRGKIDVGMSFFAEVSLMQGIEVHCQSFKQQRRAVMYVPPASTWILVAGETIYELCKADYDFLNNGPGATPDNDEWLWGKSRGYSLGRWSFWKMRFGEIAMTEGLKDDLKEIAARAAFEMNKLAG
ncbi:hypothetical protein BDR22DRAFT_817322 [Usnea florida]